MKKILVFALVALCAFSLFANGAKEASGSDQIKAVLLTDQTGIDDKSFNAAAWRGILSFYCDNGACRGTLY